MKAERIDENKNLKNAVKSNDPQAPLAVPVRACLAGFTEFSASRCVAGMPRTGQIFPKKRQFWQLLASDQLVESKLHNKFESETLYIFHQVMLISPE